MNSLRMGVIGMSDDTVRKVYPKYENFEKLEASLTVKNESWLQVFTCLLQDYSVSGVIAILTLVVLGIGFWRFDDIWGLVAAESLVVAFSIFAILISRFDVTKNEKTKSSANELGDEPSSSRVT